MNNRSRKFILRAAQTSIARIFFSHFTRITAVVTCVCFLYSAVLSQTIHAIVTPAEETHSSLNAYSGEFSVPYALGRITDAQYMRSDRVVINIQDLHCHAEVQRNIGKILGLIDRQYGLSKVYVEGGVGPVDTSWVQALDNRKYREKVVETLMDGGVLTGSEYYSILSGKFNLLQGLEDKTLYTQNLARLGTIINQRAEMQSRLPEFAKSITTIQDHYYTSRNQQLNRIIARHDAGALSAEKYLRLLLQLAKRADADLNEYPNTVSFVRLFELQKGLKSKKINKQLVHFLGTLKEKLPYATYRRLMDNSSGNARAEELYAALKRASNEHALDLTSEYKELHRFFTFADENQNINPVALVREEKKLISDLHDRFSASAAEREVAYIADFFEYVERYVNNKLSAEDHRYYVSHQAKFRQLWAKYTTTNTLPALEPYYAVLDKFYAVNIERNNSFLKNIFSNDLPAPAAGGVLRVPRVDQLATVTESLKSAKEIIVVVTGGFHTDGLTHLLKDRGISYLVITPSITKDAKIAEATYSELAKQQAAVFGAQAFALMLESTFLKSKKSTADINASDFAEARAWAEKQRIPAAQIEQFINNFITRKKANEVFAETYVRQWWKTEKNQGKDSAALLAELNKSLEGTEAKAALSDDESSLTLTSGDAPVTIRLTDATGQYVSSDGSRIAAKRELREVAIVAAVATLFFIISAIVPNVSGIRTAITALTLGVALWKAINGLTMQYQASVIEQAVQKAQGYPAIKARTDMIAPGMTVANYFEDIKTRYKLPQNILLTILSDQPDKPAMAYHQQEKALNRIGINPRVFYEIERIDKNVARSIIVMHELTHLREEAVFTKMSGKITTALQRLTASGGGELIAYRRQMRHAYLLYPGMVRSIFKRMTFTLNPGKGTPVAPQGPPAQKKPFFSFPGVTVTNLDDVKKIVRETMIEQGKDRNENTSDFDSEVTYYSVLLWTVNNGDPTAITIEDQKIAESFYATANMTDQELNDFGVVEYDNMQEPTAQERKNILMVNLGLNAGLGSSVKRGEYKKNLIKQFLNLISPGIGAKGTDLYFLLQINGKEVPVNISEIKLLQAAVNAKMFGKLAVREVVNIESAPSILGLYDQMNIYGRNGIDHPWKKLTYRQIFAQEGIQLDEPHRVGFLPGLNREIPKKMPTDEEQKIENLRAAGESKKSFPPQITASGSHGQVIFWLLKNLLDPEFEEKQGWAEEGKSTIIAITNSDGVGNRVDAKIASHVARTNTPIAMLATPRTTDDVKGGIFGLLTKGSTRFPWVLELAVAAKNKEKEVFLRKGVEKDGAAPGDGGRFGKQLFNTNSVVLNLSVLGPFVRELKDYMGLDEYLELITPSPIVSDKMQGATPYVQIEGAMGTSILKINAYLESKIILGDPTIMALMKKYSIPTQNFKFLRIINIPRKFFAPVKFSWDFIYQTLTSLMKINTETWIPDMMREDTFPKIMPDGDDGTSKWYLEMHNCQQAFGQADLSKCTSFDASGIREECAVTWSDAAFVGTFAISSRYKGLINLNEALNDSLLPGRTKGFLYFENAVIDIDEKGILTFSTDVGGSKKQWTLQYLSNGKFRELVTTQKDSGAISFTSTVTGDKAFISHARIKSLGTYLIKFGTAGWRPETKDFTLARVQLFAEALARTYETENGDDRSRAILIGFDPRKNNKEFVREMASILTGHGISVDIIAQEPTITPALAIFAAEKRYGKDYHYVVNFSASHSSNRYSGIKLLLPNGRPAPDATTQTIQKIVNELGDNKNNEAIPSLVYDDAKAIGLLHEVSVTEAVKEYVDPFIRDKRDSGAWDKVTAYLAADDRAFITFDAMQGGSVSYWEAIMDRLLIDVNDARKQLNLPPRTADSLFRTVHRANADPAFSEVGGVPNPYTRKNIATILGLLNENSRPDHELAIMVDCDGDSVAAADKEGTLKANEIGAILLYEAVRKQWTNTVKQDEWPDLLITQSIATSGMAHALATYFNNQNEKNHISARIKFTPDTEVGFKSLPPAMDDLAAAGKKADRPFKRVLGFESSGHVWADGWTGMDDGLFVGFDLIAAVAGWNEDKNSLPPSFKGLSQIRKEIDALIGSRYAFEEQSVEESAAARSSALFKLNENEITRTINQLLELNNYPAKVQECILTDGVKIILTNGDWLLIRKSGTEPQFRIATQAIMPNDAPPESYRNSTLFAICKELLGATETNDGDSDEAALNASTNPLPADKEVLQPVIKAISSPLAAAVLLLNSAIAENIGGDRPIFAAAPVISKMLWGVLMKDATPLSGLKRRAEVTGGVFIAARTASSQQEWTDLLRQTIIAASNHANRQSIVNDGLFVVISQETGEANFTTGNGEKTSSILARQITCGNGYIVEFISPYFEDGRDTIPQQLLTFISEDPRVRAVFPDSIGTENRDSGAPYAVIENSNMDERSLAAQPVRFAAMGQAVRINALEHADTPELLGSIRDIETAFINRNARQVSARPFLTAGVIIDTFEDLHRLNSAQRLEELRDSAPGHSNDGTSYLAVSLKLSPAILAEALKPNSKTHRELAEIVTKMHAAKLSATISIAIENLDTPEGFAQFHAAAGILLAENQIDANSITLRQEAMNREQVNKLVPADLNTVVHGVKINALLAVRFEQSDFYIVRPAFAEEGIGYDMTYVLGSNLVSSVPARASLELTRETAQETIVVDPQIAAKELDALRAKTSAVCLGDDMRAAVRDDASLEDGIRAFILSLFRAKKTDPQYQFNEGFDEGFGARAAAADTEINRLLTFSWFPNADLDRNVAALRLAEQCIAQLTLPITSKKPGDPLRDSRLLGTLYAKLGTLLIKDTPAGMPIDNVRLQARAQAARYISKLQSPGTVAGSSAAGTFDRDTRQLNRLGEQAESVLKEATNGSSKASIIQPRAQELINRLGAYMDMQDVDNPSYSIAAQWIIQLLPYGKFEFKTTIRKFTQESLPEAMRAVLEAA